MSQLKARRLLPLQRVWGNQNWIRIQRSESKQRVQKVTEASRVRHPRGEREQEKGQRRCLSERRENVEIKTRTFRSSAVAFTVGGGLEVVREEKRTRF